MIKNQYLRLVETGKLSLEQAAREADARRERGDDLGPPPIPTPPTKRRHENTQPLQGQQMNMGQLQPNQQFDFSEITHRQMEPMRSQDQGITVAPASNNPNNGGQHTSPGHGSGGDKMPHAGNGNSWAGDWSSGLRYSPDLNLGDMGNMGMSMYTDMDMNMDMGGGGGDDDWGLDFDNM
jgi:hypothetical protein